MRYTNTLKYAFAGLIFGLFFPVLAWVIDGFFFRELEFGLNTIFELHQSNPIHYVIDSAPLVLGGAFAYIGFLTDKIITNYEKEIDYSFYKVTNNRLLKRLRFGNTSAPIIILSVLFTVYFIIRDFNYKQESDAPVINYSGRQRMLSQKIAKSSLYLYSIEDEKKFHSNVLEEALSTFIEAHHNLTGKSNSLNFSEIHTNSRQVKVLYDSINPYYEGIVTGTQQLLQSYKRLTNSTDSAAIRKYKSEMEAAVKKIEKNERAFLPIMDKIVFIYDKEAQEKLETVNKLGLIVVIVFSILIVAFSIFVLKPVIFRIRRAFAEVEVAGEKLEEKNKKLLSSEKELKQSAAHLQNTNEYLERTQKDLATYIQRVSEAKKMAKLAAYDFYPQTNKIVHTEHLNMILNIDEEKEITPSLLESYIHRDDYATVMESQNCAVKEKKDSFYRFRIKTEGLKNWNWFQGATHCIVKNGNVDYVVNSLQNITEIVEKEQEIEKLLKEVNIQNQELQSSEEELRQNADQLQSINDDLFVAQREIEERQRLLLRAEKLAKIGSFDILIQTLSFSYSDNLAKIYGLEEEEMREMSVHSKYFEQEDREKIRNCIAELIHGKNENFSITAHFKNLEDTNWRVFRLEGNLIRDVMGNPERILGVVQDVTEIKKQQEEVENAKKQLESLSNNLQGIMYRTLIDEDWTMKFISKGVERITGYPASDFIDNETRTFASIIHTDDNFIDSEIEQAIKNKESYKIEYRLVHKNGSMVWVEETGQMVEDKKNEVRFLDGVLMDITQRKQAEQIIEKQTQKLLSSQKELEQQQQMLSDAEKMAKMGSYVWDLHTRKIKHSENLPNIYGLEKDTVIDQIIFDAIIHTEEREQHQRAIAEAMMAGREEVFTTYRAKPTNLPENYWRHYRTYSIIKYNEEGEPITVIGTAQDISEEVAQQKMQEQLLSYVQENTNNLEEAQRIAQVVSYEMNIITKKVDWSNSFVDVFKVKEHEVPQDTTIFQKWIKQEDLVALNEAWSDAIANKEIFNAVYRVETPHSNTIYIKERGYPIFDETGSIIRMKGTLQDITQAELAKKKVEESSLQLEKQNKNLVSSINYAQRIQSAMLGGTQDLTAIFEDAFVFFEPKDVVSGDFYWYNEIGTRKIVIVGDCTGHGVPGAFMSLLGTTLLNEAILQRQITTPSKVLDFIQAEIRRILKQDTTGNRDGMDMAIVVVDTSVGMIEFAGAKNPLVYIHKKKVKGGAEFNMTIIKGDVHPIGGRTEKFIDEKYTNHSIEIEHVEAFYIYSDGYQDQFGGDEGRKFMSKNFRQLLYDTYNGSLRRQRVALKRNLMDWTGTEYDQTDDICVIGISL